MTTHPGDSREQRAAESLMLSLLEGTLGLRLVPHRLRTPGGATVQLDGWCSDPLVLCEAWAHQGLAKSAQSAKVMRDAFKLAFAERTIGRPARKILLFACSDAASCFKKGWHAEALRVFGVELQVVDLASDVREELQRAQARQYR